MRAYNGGQKAECLPTMNADLLQNVVTLPEACHHWQKARKTLEMAIAKDRLQYRQAGRIYLITVESLTARWGPPRVPLCVYILGSCRT